MRVERYRVLVGGLLVAALGFAVLGVWLPAFVLLGAAAYGHGVKVGFSAGYVKGGDVLRRPERHISRILR